METVARDEASFARSSDARRISCLDLFQMVGTEIHAPFRGSGRAVLMEAMGQGIKAEITATPADRP